jgi:hypothetical protein
MVNSLAMRPPSSDGKSTGYFKPEVTRSNRVVGSTPVESLSMDAALSERAELVKEAMDIQAALGDRNKVGPDGKRLSDHDYHEWRRRAQYALAARQRRMHDLKEHVRKLRQQTTLVESGVSDTSDRGLLKSAYELLRKLAKEGVDFDTQEQAQMDVFRAHLQGAA